MKQIKSNHRSHLSQSLYAVKKFLYASLGTIGVLAFAGQMFFASGVQAYTQMASRSVVINSDVISASTLYTITFTPNTSTAIGTIIIDFCNTDPIPGDTCTAPTGFNLSIGTPTYPTGGGLTPANWTHVTAVGATNSTAGFYTNAAAQTPNGTAVTMALGGVTNPSVVGSFYARILTYNANSTTETGAYTSTSIGAPVDAGGAALYITSSVVVTAKVQEQLTFCLFTGASCGVGNTIALGLLTNGSYILDATHTYGDDNTQFSLSTNALHSVNVQAFGNILTSGTNYIEYNGVSGMGTLATTAYTNSANTSNQFGFLVGTHAAGTTMTITAPYNNGVGAGGLNFGSSPPSFTGGTATNGQLTTGSLTFGFNIANLSSATGDQLLTMPAGGANGQILFIAVITPTTIPGVYTSNMMFVATGTF